MEVELGQKTTEPELETLALENDPTLGDSLVETHDLENVEFGESNLHLENEIAKITVEEDFETIGEFEEATKNYTAPQSDEPLLQDAKFTEAEARKELAELAHAKQHNRRASVTKPNPNLPRFSLYTRHV